MNVLSNVGCMTINVTPHLVQLTYEAALKSFWRRRALEKFLRQVRISDRHLATWSQDEVKREFLDRTFAALQKSPSSNAVISNMAQALAEQISFPDLENWEDSVVKMQAAKKAVKDLKEYLNAQKVSAEAAREREAIKEVAREQAQALQRARGTLSELGDRLALLTSKQGTQSGGYEYEAWFYDLINFFELEHRRPYVAAGRQIDGSLTIDGTTYLIELKFTEKPSGGPDIDIFRGKVESKADNTMGVFVSMAGFSSVAIQDASGKKSTLLLLDASHIYLILSGGMTCSEVIRRIRRHASQTGESYLPVAGFGGA